MRVYEFERKSEVHGVAVMQLSDFLLTLLGGDFDAKAASTVRSMLQVAKKRVGRALSRKRLHDTLYEAFYLAPIKDASHDLLDLPRFAMMEGRLRLCRILMSPYDLACGVQCGCRVALSSAAPVTPYNSAPIRRRHSGAILMSNAPDEVVLVDARQRRPHFSLETANHLEAIAVHKFAEDVDAEARQLALISIVQRMYSFPFRVKVSDSRMGVRHHVLIDNVVPLPTKVARLRNLDICVTQRLPSVKYPETTLILEALGIPIMPRYDWKARINPTLAAVSNHSDKSDATSRTHFVVQERSLRAWKHVLYDLVVPVRGLTLESLRELPMHPIEELTRVHEREIEECPCEQAVYLLARVIKWAASAERDELSFAKLADSI